MKGGTPIDIATGEDAPVTIALSATDVYWGTTGVLQTVPGGVYRAPIAGGSATTVVSASAGIDQVSIVGGQLYWSVQDFKFGSTDSGVWQANLDGTQPTMVIDNAATQATFAVAGGQVYMNSGGGLVRSFSSGQTTNPFPNGAFGIATATNGSALYFVSYGGALETLALPVPNGQNVTVIDPGPGGVSVAGYSTLAVDSASAYWTSCTKVAPTTCTLYREALAGGGATPLGTHAGTQGCVAIDGTHVYWGVDGAILRYPK